MFYNAGVENFSQYINIKKHSIARFKKVFKFKNSKRYRLSFYFYNIIYKNTYFDYIRYNYKLNNRYIISSFYRDIFKNSYNRPFFITFCPLKRSEVIEAKNYWIEKGFKTFVITRYMSKLMFSGGICGSIFTGRLMLVYAIDVNDFFNYFFEYNKKEDQIFEFEVIKPRLINVYNKFFDFYKFSRIIEQQKKFNNFFVSVNKTNMISVFGIIKVVQFFNSSFFNFFCFYFLKIFIFLINENKNRHLLIQPKIK